MYREIVFRAGETEFRDTVLTMNEFVSIRKKWQQYVPDRWWGDSIDVRFCLINQLRQLQGKRLLDIGCNIGFMLTELAPSNEKHGFDLELNLLQTAKSLNPSAILLAASMFEAFPYHEQSFDVVIMANVMPYFEISCKSLTKEQHKKHVFAEVQRVLKPGGKLFLTTPNGDNFCYRHTRKAHLADVQEALQDFSQVNIYGWNPLPSPIFLLPNSLTRRIPRKYYKYLFIPSPLLARIPYMMELLKSLMTKHSMTRRAKAFYVECVK